MLMEMGREAFSGRTNVKICKGIQWNTATTTITEKYINFMIQSINFPYHQNCNSSIIF